MKLEALDGLRGCTTSSTLTSIPVKSLRAQGFVITRDKLLEMGIASLSDGKGNLVFDTVQGEQKLPEVITPETAQALPAALEQLNTITASVLPAGVDKAKLKNAGKWLLFLLLGYGLVRLLTRSREPKQRSLNGLKPATHLAVVHI